MKKFKKIYLTFLFSALMAFGGLLLNIQAPQKNYAFAQSNVLPANAVFAKYTKTEDDYILIPNSNILHQDAVFLENNQVVIFDIGSQQDFITDITVDLYLNSVSVDNTGENKVAEIIFETFEHPVGDGDIQTLRMIFDTYEFVNSEGKYQINLEYLDKNVIKQTLSFTFYLYKQSTYFTSNSPAVSVQNVNQTIPAMESASYARTHEFRYTNDYTSAQRLSLPTITFDSNKFEVSISKNNSGITQNTYISLDGNGNLNQTLPIVLAKKDGNNVTVTFNDIGSYTVNYFMLYKSEGEKFLFANTNAKLKPDRMQLFGFQIYHSNINATSSTDQQQEFKVILDDNTISANHQTDITFTQINNRFVANTLFSQPDISKNEFVLKNIDSRVVFNGNNLSAQSTNQAPVSFKYNATIQNSFYFKLKQSTSENTVWERFLNYDGRPFSDVGTYLVKISYTSDLSTTTTEYTQWFYFSISNEIPSSSVKANGVDLSTGSFTKEVVEVSFNQTYNPFDSASKLSVYRQDAISSARVFVKEVAYNTVETFSQNGIYTVEIARGRNFGSKQTSQFIIDTTPITGLIARDVNTNLIKGGASGFYTNQSVAVEWNNKQSNNNTVTAQYRYIPLTQISNFTNAEYANYYTQGQFIPVPYALNYQPSHELSTIPYQNTLHMSTLTSANIFSQQGLYMVRASDKAGNEAFTYFFIDKTTPTVLQKDTFGNYLTDYSKLNIVSETVTVQWGNYKVIKTNLDLTEMDFDTWLTPGQEETGTNLDPWLFRMLKEKANNALIGNPDGDFKLAIVGGQRRLHFAPKIDVDNIQVAVGSNGFVRLTTNYEGLTRVGNHSAQIDATKLVDGKLKEIETSYTFQINDESNKNPTPATLYSISTSTDVSKTRVRFKSENQDATFEYEDLTSHNYRVAISDQSVLQTYFMPINTDILQLQFLTTTDESSIEIEQVVVYYYPYTTDYTINNNGNTVEGRSMTLSTTPIEIVVYDYSQGINLATLEDAVANLWVWDVNIEEIYISNISHTQTMAGKYEVVRTYRQNAEILQTLSNKADYMTRHLTFIVEREDVISKGEDRIIDGQNYTFSVVGGSSFIEILSGNDNAMKFTSLYEARSYTPQQQYVLLETNKLPVKLGFPIAKFGQVIGNDFMFISNNYFYANHKDAYINSFEMGVKVTHLASNTVVSSNLKTTISDTQPASGVNYIRLDNGLYMIFENAQNGYLVLSQNFTQEGKYQVDFFQKNTAIKGKTSSISMFFQITNIAPNFDIVDEYGDQLPKHDTQDIFYANQNQVRVTWTDSTNPYYAKINKNQIYYTINNGTLIKVNNIDTLSDGITNYFVLPTTLEGAEIVVRMQYEGQQNDYAPGAFAKSKTIIVDKTAPTASINNLIAKMGDGSLFNPQTLRVGHNQATRYSKTINTGTLAHFSFAVDRANLQSLILNNLNADTVSLYYRSVDKYNASIEEFDPSQNDALLQLESGNLFTKYHEISASFENRKYYEIAEVDKAGNIAVYTIYLTDIAKDLENEQSLKENNVNYKDFLNEDFKLIQFESYQENETTPLTRFETLLSASETNYNIKLYSKQFFNLNFVNPLGYQWFLLTFGTNKYLASPHLEGQVYKISGGNWQPVNFKDEIYLTVARNNYVFEIKNTSLSNITLNVVVSNNKLAFQTPQANNPSLTITNTSANDTELVKWETVSIWEYQNGIYSAFAMFDTSQTEPIDREPELEGFNLATYQVNGNNTVFTLNVKNQAYYRIKVVDNFGLEYIMTHLAGTQFVQQIEELEGRALTVDNTSEDINYYISNSGFKYTYYPALTQSVVLKIGVLNLEDNNVVWHNYTITGSSFEMDSTFNQYASIATFTNYRTITLRVNTQQTSNVYNGFSVIYEITSQTLTPIQDNPDNQEEEVINFKVYSLLPKTILTGKNKQDLSDILLRNEGLVSEPITIEFAQTNQFDYPVNVYVSYNNQTKIQLESGQTFSLIGTYVITKEFTGAMSVYPISSETFTISDQAATYFSVVQYDETLGRYVDVLQSPNAYKLERPIQFEQTYITQHYIVNTTDWKINLSASQFMEIVPNEGVFEMYDEIKKGDQNQVSTFIRTLSNHNTSADNKSFNYYKTTIAITYIPKANKIVKDFYYLDNQANHNFLVNSEKVYTLVKDQDLTNQVEIYWLNYHLIPENKITATIYYGQDKQPLSSSIIKTRGTSDYVTLNRSGNYSFTFTDQAGNVHKFDYSSTITESSSAFEFVFLNNVIFTVNDQAPIQRAIYNQDVKITIPSYTMTYYDNNARPQISVTRDGIATTDYISNHSTRTYTFSKPGLYKVYFSAKVKAQEVRQEAYIFEIVKEKQLNWEFNVKSYGDYYIEQIKKNGVDVTATLSNSSLGEVVIIKKDGQNLVRLKNILISLYDEQTGAGNWTITINTNNDLNQKFTYSFIISDSNPPIIVSVPLGASTTDIITVSFNMKNLYEEVGESVLKIGTYQLEINEDYFQGDYQETRNIEISAIGDTYIQVFTPSGRLIYTYRVTRTVPLNSVAIIIIVVSTLAAAGLIVMFVLLRKRMKIR